MCVTDSHDMTLAVKVALNPNTTNQPYEWILKWFGTIVLLNIRVGLPFEVLLR